MNIIKKDDQYKFDSVIEINQTGELFYELLFDTFKKYNDEKSKDEFSRMSPLYGIQLMPRQYPLECLSNLIVRCLYQQYP